MALKASDETVRIDFGDGDWVELRKYMRRGDTKFAQDHMAVARIVLGEPNVGILAGSYNTALMFKMITSWSEPEPVTFEAVDGLDDNVAERVLAVISENNKLRDNEQSAPLGSSSGSPSERPADNSASMSTPPGRESSPT